MADNIIKLNIEEDSEAIKAARTLLESEIGYHQQTIDNAEQALKALQDRVIEIEIELVKETRNDVVKQLKTEQKDGKANIKKQKANIETFSNILPEKKLDLAKLNSMTGK